MNTRMELWKNYRLEIEKNISLQQAVRNSDERYQILEKRLLNIFPKYHSKYKTNLSVFTASTNEVKTSSHYDVSKLEKILDSFNFVEDDHGVSFASIDRIDFSSKEMDDVIAAVQKGKIKNIEYVDVTKTSLVQVEKTKKVQIGGKVKKLRIAIDGPSGSGKSTVAKLVAKKHGLTYINTGLIYRAIALNAINNNIDLANESEVISSCEKNMIALHPNEVVFLKGVDVTKAVRSDKVSQGASKVAAIAKVREYALEISKDYAKQPGTVMDGRDTTFKIMPDADLKIFLDTAPEVRAKRRVEQNKILGFGIDYENILSEIKERDHRDRTRAVDPLHKTEDAHLIDASNMNIEEVVKEIEKLISNVK